MTIPQIKEFILGPSDRESILELIGNEKEELVNGNCWHYILKIENNSKALIHHASSNTNFLDNVERGFKSYLNDFSKPRFFDLLFLCTLYPILLPNNYLSLPKDKIDVSLPVKIQKLLTAGRGYLIYYHQIEILYSALTNSTHSESVQFRKDWNLKKEYTRQIANSTKISDSQSLLDLIEKYTLDNNMFFYQANYHGAYNLYNVINKV